jgi:hypothetical protein
MIYEITKFLREIREPYRMNEKKGELILLDTESQFLFGSSENPLTLEGPHLEYVWIDEGGMMPRLAWDVAQRRTGYGGEIGGGESGQILITTIPYFEGWLKTDVYMPAMKGEEWVTWIKCRTADNPDYPKAEIERMKKSMRPEKFRIYYEGEWARAAGLIFPDPADDQIIVNPETEFAWNKGSCPICHGEVCSGMIPCDWPAFSGHDYGWNAPTTGIWLRLSPDDVAYVVADYEQANMTIDEHLRVWYANGLQHIDESWGDPANPEVWERAQDMGYPLTAGNNNVIAGIDEVYNRLVTGRLKVFPECKIFLDHRATYRWETNPKDDNMLVDRPLKPQPAEHIMDALRYVCMGIVERGQARADPTIRTRGRNLVEV